MDYFCISPSLWLVLFLSPLTLYKKHMKRVLFLALVLLLGCSKDDDPVDSCGCESVMAFDNSEQRYFPVTLKVCHIEEELEQKGQLTIENGIKYISVNDWSHWRQMAFEQGCMSAP